MASALKENDQDADRQSSSIAPDEQDLEGMYKKVGITAVFAAANYVKMSKPRRAA